MRSRIQLERPGRALVTMTITLSMDEWIQLKGQLRDSQKILVYPASSLNQQINDLVEKITKHFDSNTCAEEEGDD